MWGGPEIQAVGQLPHSDGYGLSESTQFYGELRAIDPYLDHDSVGLSYAGATVTQAIERVGWKP